MTPPDLSNWDKLSDYCRRSIIRLNAQGLPHDITEELLVKWIKGNGWEKAMNAIIQAVNDKCLSVLHVESILYPIKPKETYSHKVYSEADIAALANKPQLPKYNQQENEEWWLSLTEAEKQKQVDYFCWRHVMFECLVKAGRVKPMEDSFIKDSWFGALLDVLERR